jgi:hypothetical protein
MDLMDKSAGSEIASGETCVSAAEAGAAGGAGAV